MRRSVEGTFRIEALSHHWSRANAGQADRAYLPRTARVADRGHCAIGSGVRKVIRSGATEFTCRRAVQSKPKTGPWRNPLCWPGTRATRVNGFCLVVLTGGRPVLRSGPVSASPTTWSRFFEGFRRQPKTNPRFGQAQRAKGSPQNFPPTPSTP